MKPWPPAWVMWPQADVAEDYWQPKAPAPLVRMTYADYLAEGVRNGTVTVWRTPEWDLMEIVRVPDCA